MGFPIPSVNQFCELQMPAECGHPVTTEVPSLPLDNDPELEQEVLAALSLLISPPPVFMAAFQWLIISKYDQHANRKDSVTRQTEEPTKTSTKQSLLTVGRTDRRTATAQKPRAQEQLSNCSLVFPQLPRHTKHAPSLHTTLREAHGTKDDPSFFLHTTLKGAHGTKHALFTPRG